jgi:peptidoglycan/LPS O-acetylase OafA/YrhL
LVLAAATALSLVGFLGGSVWPSALLAQSLHVTNYWVIRHGWWYGMAPGTWVYWSLAIEEHFYLVFPLAYLVLRRLGWSAQKQAAALLAVCALVLLWRYVLIYGFEVYKERTYVATDTRIDSILAGCILAVRGNPVLDRETIDEGRLLKLWLPLGVIAVAASLIYRDAAFEQTLRYSLQSFGLTPIFVAAIIWHDRGPFRVLNTWPARHLGLLSYSLYLMHPAVLYAFETRSQLPVPIRSSLAFVILIVLATLLYRYVEKPCARLRRGIAKYMADRARAKASRAAAKPIAA